MTRGADLPLACPACDRRHGGEERFCVACGLPLVRAEGPTEAVPASPAQERARKVRKQYAEGPLVKVATARHPVEAELIQGLLLEVGVPSSVVRPGGSQVPIMSATATAIFVPASGADVAREALAVPDRAVAPVRLERDPSRVRAARLLAATLLVTVLAASVSHLLIAVS